MRRAAAEQADYGTDAPAVMRNLLLSGAVCLLLALFGPRRLQFGRVEVLLGWSLLWPAGFLLGGGLLFLLYVKVGKFRHRDFMLRMHAWSGDEQVLDVGCGRGLLLAGVAKQMELMGGIGRAMGIDVWSTSDMGGNAEAATWRNLEIEGVAARCALITGPAQTMSFEDRSFDLVVSNLCLHNLYDKNQRLEAVRQIARVLRPGGEALLSDYKHTAEYAAELKRAGFMVEQKWGSWLTTFPPLRVVVARKPPQAAPHLRCAEDRMMAEDTAGTALRVELQKQLGALLAGGQAHAGFDKAVAGLPAESRGVRPERVPYSAWQLLEHLRITQRDILDFSTNCNGAGYKALKWPDEYWPKESAPASDGAWQASLDSVRKDRETFEALLKAKEADLVTPFAWGEGQTLLREALLIADHTAYHVGELVLLRRLLGAWES